MTHDARTAARERRIGRALLAAWWSNLFVWAMLLMLLMASLALAYVPLGAWNFPLGLAIAAAKAALVGYAFMTLRRSPPLVLLVVGAAAICVGAMFVLTFSDVFTRVRGFDLLNR